MHGFINETAIKCGWKLTGLLLEKPCQLRMYNWCLSWVSFDVITVSSPSTALRQERIAKLTAMSSKSDNDNLRRDTTVTNLSQAQLFPSIPHITQLPEVSQYVCKTSSSAQESVKKLIHWLFWCVSIFFKDRASWRPIISFWLSGKSSNSARVNRHSTTHWQFN